MNGELRRAVVVVANPLGLHMRPAAAFAEQARGFRSRVTVRFKDREVDGKSWLDLMLLAAEKDSQLTLEVAGDDAADALPVLAELLAAPGDDTGGDPPPPKG
jgi:phosphotransferase system HPr (HPr) family protein